VLGGIFRNARQQVSRRLSGGPAAAEIRTAFSRDFRIRPRGTGLERVLSCTMKIVVDFDRCESNAVCMGIAPDIFEVRDDGFLYILDENPSEARRAEVQEAVDMCPKAAISIQE
jgi:ferredoxin